MKESTNPRYIMIGNLGSAQSVMTKGIIQKKNLYENIKFININESEENLQFARDNRIKEIPTFINEETGEKFDFPQWKIEIKRYK